MKVWLLVVYISAGGNPHIVVDNIATQADCMRTGSQIVNWAQGAYSKFQCFEIAKVKP